MLRLCCAISGHRQLHLCICSDSSALLRLQPSPLTLPLSLPSSPCIYRQAKDVLIEKVQDYLEQKIRFADRMLVKYAIEKIQVGSDGG